MTDKPKRPTDANQLAHMIAGIATGDVDDTPETKAEAQRNPESRNLGWLVFWKCTIRGF